MGVGVRYIADNVDEAIDFYLTGWVSKEQVAARSSSLTRRATRLKSSSLEGQGTDRLAHSLDKLSCRE